jgi:general L-amino acid transport system permease protein
MTSAAEPSPPKVSLLYDPKFRSIVYQAALSAVILLLAFAAVSNAIDNLRHANIATGFAFWNHTAGFDISQTLIAYSIDVSTYGRAFWVGLLNTLLVAGLGIVFATILGVFIGIARLSRNFIVARLAGSYVELIRNVPLLLQLYFWYNAVLKVLPELPDSIALRGGIALNNRGLFLPRPIFGENAGIIFYALATALATAFALRLFARRYQQRTGRELPVLSLSFLFIVGLPTAAFLAIGVPVRFDYPDVGRFNMQGGIEILPEFAALLFGLIIYSASFIAEAVRAGIQAVPTGQTEAARALGLRPGLTLRLVVIPQAMRVIMPPLTNQYLNLTKNSSLAVAIGYPDLVQVFTGTVLNLTGQAVEVVAITMAVYLTISLFTSLILNWYNARFALIEQ